MSLQSPDVAARPSNRQRVARPTRAAKGRTTDPLFRREMRERWRRPLTLLQLLIFASALAYIGYNIYYTTVPLNAWASTAALTGVGRKFFFTLSLWHALAWIPGGLLLAAPALAAERERGHLTDWVLAGLTPTAIVRAKWRALAGFVLVMVCVPFPIFALCFPLGGVSPLDFLAVFALTVAIALNSVALGLMVSANCASVTGALWGTLAMSFAALLMGAPILVATVGESWTATLTLALTTCWMPVIWIAACAATFEREVENHLKNDEPSYAPPTVEPPPAAVARTGAEAAFKAAAETAMATEPIPATSKAATAPEIPATSKTAGASEFSQVETLMLRAARNNAIAHRDVKRRLNSRRADSLFSEEEMPRIALWSWVLCWLSIGVAGLLTLRISDELGATGGLLRGVIFVVLVAAMAFVGVGAAPGFTRERAQRMLSALQMTALSPLDIVVGKIAGVLLLCAQYFAGALLAGCVWALHIGPQSALMLAVFGVSCVVFTAMGSLTLSLWSRKTEIVALGALASIAGLWWVLPALYINNNFSLFFHAPVWLEKLWLAPIRALLQPASDGQCALALGQLAALCLAAALSMGALCILQLRRTRAEEEETGLLQRDLSRGWK